MWIEIRNVLEMKLRPGDVIILRKDRILRVEIALIPHLLRQNFTYVADMPRFVNIFGYDW
jgi:hypothetical protein